MRTIHRDIVGAFIFSKDDKLLIGKAGVYAGKWVIPGGGIDEDETKMQAIIREVREETGLVIEETMIEELERTLTGESEKTLRETGETVHVEMSFNNFIVRLENNANEIEVKADDDFTNARWVGRDELDKIDFSPPTVETLKLLGYISADA